MDSFNFIKKSVLTIDSAKDLISNDYIEWALRLISNGHISAPRNVVIYLKSELLGYNKF